MGEDNFRVLTDGGVEFRTEFGDTEPATRAILRGIAAVKGVDETEVDTLFENVEVDGLNQLIRHSDRNGCYVSVEFTIDGYTVLVSGDRYVTIHSERPRC